MKIVVSVGGFNINTTLANFLKDNPDCRTSKDAIVRLIANTGVAVLRNDRSDPAIFLSAAK
jgi:hypothetical protein